MQHVLSVEEVFHAPHQSALISQYLRRSQLCLHASDFLCRPAVPSFLLPGCGDETEALSSPVWLDVASQAASLHKSHVKTCKSGQHRSTFWMQ